jgi:hypothetical protein
MSDIFVSYDSEDRERVRHLVEVFEAQGWSVWWDRHIQTGEPFARVIEREIEAAQVVVVVWSHTSIDSDWVRAEAEDGRKRGRLLPVLLDPVEPPMPFGQIQTADLVWWDGSAPARRHQDAGLHTLLADLRGRMRGPTEHVAVRIEPTEPWAWRTAARRPGRVGAVALAVATLVALAVVGWRLRPTPPVARDNPGAAGGTAQGVAEQAPGALRQGADGPAVEQTRSQAGVEGPEPSRLGSRASPPSAVARAASGHWRAMVTYGDGATLEERFTFDIDGARLSGTASMRGYVNRREVLDGIVDGDRLSFRTRGRLKVDLFGSRDVTYVYEAVPEAGGLRFRLRDEGTGDLAIVFTATRLSAEEAARVATGGTRPQLNGMTTNDLYAIGHVRDVFSRLEGGARACYRAAEFDPVDHQVVVYDVTLSGAGLVQAVETRPTGTSLDTCMQAVISKAEWGPTATGGPGTLRLMVGARLPWNP